MAYKVIITVPDVGQKFEKEIKLMSESGFDVVWKPLNNTSDANVVKENVKGYDFVIAGGEIWDKEVINSVKKDMSMIVRFGVGYDMVDISAATAAGIAVSNTPGMNSGAVAEHTIALMLSLARRVCKYDREIRRGIWKTELSDGLFGKVIGLVGFGAIATEVVKLVSGFSVNIVVYDIVKNEEAVKSLNVKYMELDDLLLNSDFVSIHLPLNNNTKGMVDKNFFEKMKPGAFLINTSRGLIVNENALINALRKGLIAGAGLDVFEKEPLSSDNQLCEFENVILTPHAASTNHEGYNGMMKGAVQNIFNFCYSKEVKSILNSEYSKYKV
ncbi:MAG: phosphoglycerate dehydrogenase [Clostridiales bacterium]|nr:phosphoglycerate dehydrogenase [Clostridiales bacterium]